MDINTPKGAETLIQELEAAEIFERHHPKLLYCHTPKDEPARVDAVLVKGRHVVAVVETKCRPSMDLADLMVKYEGTWLVTNQKVIDNKTCAELMNVPFVGFLYLPGDKKLLFKTIWHPKRGWAKRINVRRTETQATVNGGKAVRDNAYIDMSDADVIE